jgi:hypothetical protein
MTAITEEARDALKSENMESIILAVEVVSLMRRFGYIVKDDTVMEVIKLCEKVAK